MRKPAIRKLTSPKPVIPPVTKEFREYAHAMLDTLFEDYPGTDSMVFIVDGMSGYEVASIPSSVSVKNGLFMTGHKLLFGDANDE